MNLGEPNDDWSLYGILQNLKFNVKGIAKVAEVEEPQVESVPVVPDAATGKSAMDIEVEDDQSESSQAQQFEPVNPMGPTATSPEVQSNGRSPGVTSEKSDRGQTQEEELAKAQVEVASLGKRDLENIDELDPTALGEIDNATVAIDPTQLQEPTNVAEEELEKKSNN